MARRGAACLLLALAALRWILALLVSTDRAGDITVPGSTDQGTTIVQPAALTDALTREISTYHGVETARGRIIGDGGDPEIVLTVTASRPPTCPHCTTGSKPKPSPTPGKPSASHLPIRLDLEVSRRPA